MNKKYYVKPNVRVIELDLKQTILAGSGNMDGYGRGQNMFEDGYEED